MLVLLRFTSPLTGPPTIRRRNRPVPIRGFIVASRFAVLSCAQIFGLGAACLFPDLSWDQGVIWLGGGEAVGEPQVGARIGELGSVQVV